MTPDLPILGAPPGDGRLVLEVEGRAYSRWTSATVTRSLDQAAASFSVAGSTAYPTEPNQVGVRPGDECTVSLDDDRVLTGYVDTVEIDHEGGVTITGRSRTGQLVDCSALTYSQRRVTFKAAAAKLAEPYGVSVTGLDGPKLPRVIAHRGDSVWSVLDKRAEKAGVLLTDTPAGTLHITRAGASRATTIIGPQAVASRATFSMADRYQAYIIRGTVAPDEHVIGAESVDAFGRASDPDCALYRVLEIKGKGLASREDAERRARWEAATRAGRSVTLSYTVPGWRQTDGALWESGLLATVDDRRRGIAGEFVISEISYTLDASGGTACAMTLRPPSAYDVKPLVKAKPVGAWRELRNGAKPLDPSAVAP